MKDINSILLLLVSMVTISYSSYDTGLHLGSRCNSIGQYLVHTGSRCHYIHCAYRSTPSRATIIGIARQCPLGTRVPMDLYRREVSANFYHPMSLCSERVYGHHTTDADCRVPNYGYLRQARHFYSQDYRPMIPRQVRKVYRHFPVVTRVYRGRSIQPYAIPEERATDDTQSLPVMLNDLPDGPLIEQSNNLPTREHYHQNEVDAPLPPPTVRLSDYDSYNDYQMDPDEEAEILQSMKNLVLEEDTEIMSEEDSARMKQQLLNSIFNINN